MTDSEYIDDIDKEPISKSAAELVIGDYISAAPYSEVSLKQQVNGPVSSSDILARLRENEAALRARGVAHAALFGSRARGDQRPESDTDILIELDPAARVTVFDYASLRSHIAALFDGKVDVVNRDGLKPHLKPSATTDAIYAF
jgi:uncharacterized protein